MKRKINHIVIHCTAGHTPAERVQNFFLRPVSEGGRGWKTGGYHIIIEKDGEIKQIYPFSRVTNGVVGYNQNSIHIAYVGGVEEDDVTRAKDTRTEIQKDAIEIAIHQAIRWIEAQGQDVTEGIGIVGHRDFSPDKNGSGVIEPWERIKACPSFDVIEEYGWYSSRDRLGKLPTTK